MRINDILVEFAPSGDGGGSGDYFQALASAWYNGTFDSGSLQKGIKSQQDVEQLLQRGIIGPDGVTRKYGIDYNSTFDGVIISSDDYYEHADHDETDSRTGKPFGPYDYMEFGDEELDEGLTEVDRRGFLKGLGAAAVAGATGSAMAQSQPVDASRAFANMRKDDPLVQHNKDIDEMARAIYDQIITQRGQPMDRRQQQMWMTIARDKASEKLAKYAPGRSATQPQNSGFPSQGSERRVSRNIDNFESVEQGIAEGDLNEKSTSQAQFRTMAAAAHDPKFARKVGIKPSVAREFNRADKGQDYKDLPKKATEGAPVTTTPGSIEPGGAVDNFKQQMANNTERDMAEGNRKPEPPEADYGDDYQDMVKRVKKLAGLGPLKTVYDPARRVYRNMPTAVQPRK